MTRGRTECDKLTAMQTDQIESNWNIRDVSSEMPNDANQILRNWLFYQLLLFSGFSIRCVYWFSTRAYCACVLRVQSKSLSRNYLINSNGRIARTCGTSMLGRIQLECVSWNNGHFMWTVSFCPLSTLESNYSKRNILKCVIYDRQMMQPQVVDVYNILSVPRDMC